MYKVRIAISYIVDDRWDERSWNRDYPSQQQGREWEEKPYNPNSFKDRSYNDEYDGEKEESDTESNNSNYTKKYKDSESIGSPMPSEKKVSLNINTINSKSPSKTLKMLKKVDLGAAANFGKDGDKTSITPSPNLDVLNDDFDPRAQELIDSSSAEFGNFEAAFGGSSTAKQEADDFADFSSAFSQAERNSAEPTSALKTPQKLENTHLFSLSNNAFGPEANVQKTSETNLLGDLSNFNSLSIQPLSGGIIGTTSNNNEIVISPGNVMDALSGSGEFFCLVFL